MATYIGKFTNDGTDYYFDYSTVSRTPSSALRLEEYRAYYGKLHGKMGLANLTERLKRADTKGTSAHKKSSLDEMLKGNKAGEAEKELTAKEVIDLLLQRRTAPAPAP